MLVRIDNAKDVVSLDRGFVLRMVGRFFAYWLFALALPILLGA